VAIVTPDWVRDAVFYQIFPDRFARSGRVHVPGPLEPWDSPPTNHGFKGGDLYGVVERLDYLEALGITALYLNPIFASASNHRYHTYDYLAVDPLLGGDAALRALLDAAHGRGMKVILDGVFNHTGRGFWPFHHILECGSGSPYLDWFHVNRDFLAAGRHLRAYPPESLRPAAATSQSAEALAPGTRSFSSLGYRAWWDLPALPKLNTDNPEVREYLMVVAEHWIRFGADGWRLDVPDEIDDDDFWREFRRRVKAIDPDAYIVGEIWHEDHRWLQGDQFDAYMNYPLAAAILSFCAGRHLDQRVVRQHGELEANIRPENGPTFAARLARVLSTYDPAIDAVQLNLLGSHDTPRALTMCGVDRNALRLATLVQMTVAGAPCIYYGDEVGMAGEQDPYCRGAFPTDEADWDEDLLAFFRGATALRRRHPALRRGEFALAGAAGMAAAYRRWDAADSFVVVLNAGDEPADLALTLTGIEGRALAPVTWPGWPWPAGEAVMVAGDGRASVRVPARGALILRAR
jgi:neopullulanase